MINNETRSDFICFRCGRTINQGDKMFSISGSLETPTSNNSIEAFKNCPISSLCFSCVTILLNESVMNKNMIMPQPVYESLEHDDNRKMQYERDSTIAEKGLIAIAKDGSNGSLSFQCCDDGFCLLLDCSDGETEAISRLFSWNQIAQFLIAMDPGIFSTQNKPLPSELSETLISLGFNTPDLCDQLSEEDDKGAHLMRLTIKEHLALILNSLKKAASYLGYKEGETL